MVQSSHNLNFSSCSTRIINRCLLYRGTKSISVSMLHIKVDNIFWIHYIVLRIKHDKGKNCIPNSRFLRRIRKRPWMSLGKPRTIRNINIPNFWGSLRIVWTVGSVIGSGRVWSCGWAPGPDGQSEGPEVPVCWWFLTGAALPDSDLC